jgi:hypothetical protein
MKLLGDAGVLAVAQTFAERLHVTHNRSISGGEPSDE